MPTATQREIAEAYEIVRQTGGQGTIIQRVAKFMGRDLDEHGGHSQIRRALIAYQKIVRKTSIEGDRK